MALMGRKVWVSEHEGETRMAGEIAMADGYKAAREGFPRCGNPFIENGANWRFWLAGWVSWHHGK